MTPRFVAAAVAVFAWTPLAAAAQSAPPPLHAFGALTLSPDGTRVAAIESDEPKIDGAPVTQRLVIRRLDGGPARTVRLRCGADARCTPSSPAWSRDGRRLAYVLHAAKSAERTIESVDRDGNAPQMLLRFGGTLNALRWRPDGTLSVLAVAGAHKETGATSAGADLTGEIGAHPDEQRIGVVSNGRLQWASPADLFVYEYDAIAGGGFVGTAAPGDGDNNWWIAKLYAFPARGAARVVYAPANARQQLAHPRVDPAGDRIAFIGGIMSDFGSTGGDAFVVPLAGGAATNVTPNLPASVTSLEWSCDGNRVIATQLAGPEYAVVSYAPGGGTGQTLWHGSETLRANDAAVATACGTAQTATVHQTFTRAPEIEAGALGAWHDVTHLNASAHVAATATSVAWTNDGFHVQGWLLQPDGAARGKRPMIVSVHGGPSAAVTPNFIGRGMTRDLLARGYAVFEPNPRGSFGAGEAFTQANVKDFGGGDLRDVLTGIDAVEKIAPVDENRLGITGYSYGGYMTMWTVTQTSRFKAAVAGAGVSDWLSYYGENGIDQWMIPFFGASVYEDPAVYAKSSPITFIKNVKTPTFEYVGDHDVECPMPQTQEFWHALATYNVPTSFVVYPGEGHGFRDPKHRADATRRTLAWFAKYLK